MIDKISIKVGGVEYCLVSDNKDGDCSCCTFECDNDGCNAPSILAGVCCDESIHWEKVSIESTKREYSIVINQVKYNSIDANQSSLTCGQCDFYCNGCTFPKNHSLRDACEVQDIVWKKTKEKVKEASAGLKHAKLMIEYANDCLTNREAFLNWQVLIDSNDWVDLCNHPLWHEDNEYRRKPSVVMIGGVEVPKPETTAPQVGTKYWHASPTKHTACYWNNDNYDKDILNAGILHLTKEGADKHRKALFDYNKKCCGIVL